MMKWLRKHTKQIMVVVVLLAMFSFVGGSALYSLWRPDPAKTVVMKVFGQKIIQNDLRAAQLETDVLETLLVPWKMDANREMNVRHWVMLTKEAARTGIVIPDKEINSFIEQRDRYRQQVGLGPLDNLRTARKITRPMIQRAVRDYLEVQKLAGRIARVATPSEPQLRHYVRETQDKVAVKFVALDANQFVDRDEPISDEELQRQFEQYREMEPGSGDMGFGYKYADRVKVQYVIADMVKMRVQVPVSFEEIKSYWKANKSRYMKTVYVDPPTPTSTATSSPSSTQPAEKPKKIPQQRTKSFSEARAEVASQLRKQKTKKLAIQAMSKLADELARPWNLQSTDKNTGYKPIPEEVKTAGYMKDKADQIMKRFGITLAYGETPLLSKSQLDTNFALRKAKTLGQGADVLSLAEYAFRIPAFYQSKNGKGSDTDLKLQMYQSPLSPLGAEGRSSFKVVGGQLVQAPGELQKYILFRVVDASKTQAPSNLSEVRSRVEYDIRLKRAFERVAPVAREFYAVAARIGLDAALPLFDELRTKRGVRSVLSPPAFAQRVRLTGKALNDAILSGQSTVEPPSIPSVGKSKQFVEACFEMNHPDWSQPSVERPDTDRTRAASTQPAAEPAPKVRLLSIAKLRKWFIIELVSSTPVNMDDYKTRYRQQAYFNLMRDRALVLRNQWFALKNIEERCGFVDVLKVEPSDSSEGVKSPEPPEPIRF